MPKRPATLLVFSNPYLHLTEDGEPMCVVAWDPEGHNPDRGFVGARVAHEIIQTFAPGDARQTEQRTWFEFDHDPVRLPETSYYRQALMRGELVAADEETAKKLGRKFKDPQTVLKAAKAAAIAKWTSMHGAPPAVLLDHEHGNDVAKQCADEKQKAAAAAKAAKEAAEREADGEPEDGPPPAPAPAPTPALMRRRPTEPPPAAAAPKGGE